MGGVIYGNSGLAANTPATADAAGMSSPPVVPPLCVDDLRDRLGTTCSVEVKSTLKEKIN